MRLQPSIRVALVYGVPIGDGGLAVQSANAVAALADPRLEAHAIGPGLRQWPRHGEAPPISWHTVPAAGPRWARWRLTRSLRGRAQWSHDSRVGAAAARRLDAIDPAIVYAFTLVGLESLEWARARGVPSILESPNGHIRDFRAVYVDEYRAWCRAPYRGHPIDAMVRRVEEEYRLAGRIRVSSEWSKRSLVEGGVPEEKIDVLQQPVDLVKYRPAARPRADGPLRIVSVGTLDMRKGFVYLLDAVRRLGADASLELVGGTVDRCTHDLATAKRAGLSVVVRAGDPREAYARAEVSVLPTLEDGSPFAAAEAMACGLPLVVTSCCGAAEWVEPGRTGWIVPGRNVDALVEALANARGRRDRLPEMGRAARAAAERRAEAATCDRALADWVVARCA